MLNIPSFAVWVRVKVMVRVMVKVFKYCSLCSNVIDVMLTDD